MKQDTFDVIDKAMHCCIHQTTGKLVIPFDECIFSVKKDMLGTPLHDKSHIVVLGIQDPTKWPNSECYVPVVALPMVHMLMALAIKYKTTLKQGDCKNAFVQSSCSLQMRSP